MVAGSVVANPGQGATGSQQDGSAVDVTDAASLRGLLTVLATRLDRVESQLQEVEAVKTKVLQVENELMQMDGKCATMESTLNEGVKDLTRVKEAAGAKLTELDQGMRVLYDAVEQINVKAAAKLTEHDQN